MSVCKDCIYWNKVKSIKDFGQCNVSVPHWVIVENHDRIVHSNSKVCDYFAEDLTEVITDTEHWKLSYEEAVKKNKELQDKLHTAKTQEILMQSIVDEYGKAS